MRTHGLVRLSITIIFCCLALCSHAAGQSPTRAQAMRLLEDIEQTRLLLGNIMWQVHDLRNFALSGEGTVEAAEAFDREDLRLYEKLKPLDYAASSLLAAIDLQDDRNAAGDLAFLRAELRATAPEVLKQYHTVAAAHDKTKVALLRQAGAKGLQLKMLDGQPWDDPIRERQRQLGVQLGWRTNMEPQAGFREKYWNDLQHLDIRYQLAKGKMLGITYLTIKDPVLRWDRIEPQPGHFDFTAFDRMMKLAIDQGYKVRLVLPTMGGCVPDWWVKDHPDSVIKNEKGESEYKIDGGTFAHDFMGPEKRDGDWYRSRPANLDDKATRDRFAQCVQAIADHCRQAKYADQIIDVSLDLFRPERHWRLPVGADPRQYVLHYYQQVADIAGKAFAPIPLDLEVTNGEAHSVNSDLSAHPWRSVGLTEIAGIPGVDSETPFFEDVMRAAATEAATKRAGKAVDGPFFLQNCEYGFGTMLSVNYFTSLLRDGLWSEGWFGPEGILRWGYFPQIFTYNDRQLQWSAITNGYLANRQAHLLGPTLANTRVTPADTLLLLPSASMDVKGAHTHRELIGWGWTLTALKVPYDLLPEEQLAAGVPERAKLLILPQATVLTDAQVAAIRAFVKRGGLLIASMVPASDGTQPSPLADVLGCDRLWRAGKLIEMQQIGVAGTWLQVTVPHGMHSGKYQPVPPPDTGYPRKLESRDKDQEQPYQALAALPGAEVLAHFGGPTGEVAVVSHSYGRGRALTLGYPYGSEILFADWTSVAFGKIYNGWARDPQMLGMVRWMRDALARLGYARTTTVPEGFHQRLQGWEAAATSLSFPKGAAVDEKVPWITSMTYLDGREDHRIAEVRDDLDYAAELTWHDRPGVATRYLAVSNRESAYGGERGVVQFWMMPHIFRIHIADTDIKHVYDIAAGAPVRLEEDATGVSFLTSVPPAMGRVFAVSTTNEVELFGGGKFPGESLADIAASVQKLKDAPAPAGVPAEAQGERGAVLGGADIDAWLTAHKGDPLTICYGDAAYLPAANALAKVLKAHYNINAEVSADDGAFKSTGKIGFQVDFSPSSAQILIGNAWSNNTVAMLDSNWPFNTQQAPALTSGRLTATYAWPGGERGICTLTRELELRRDDSSTFSLGYGGVSGYTPRGVNNANSPVYQQHLLVLASTPAGALNAVKALKSTLNAKAVVSAGRWQDYVKPDELAPLPAGVASLYLQPWRSSLRTASAYDAARGVGIYYKHIPNDWPQEGHDNIMKQLAAAGVKRARIAPHLSIYITKDWTAPKDGELQELLKELKGCKAAGIRPCVIFVHIPPIGKPGTRELQDWWRQGELLPAGEVGSPEFTAYSDKSYEALKFILNAARTAGFLEPDSYDMEFAQGLWWGAPAVPRPMPSTGLEALKPGGRIYEFDRGLIKRLRADGYIEPSVWWGMTYHHTDDFTDDEVPPECVGRTISFYGVWTGKTDTSWLGNGVTDRDPGPADVWPPRAPLTFQEGKAPGFVLARPETYMADRTRHDNLLTPLHAGKTPIAIASMGTVPESIPEVDTSALSGWEMKSRGLTRSLAFWLNQGAPFVLLHSLFEPWAKDGGEMSHSLMQGPVDAQTFRWQDSQPLVALKNFTDGLAGAKKLKTITDLHFQYALREDPVLIPDSQDADALRASDLLVLLPFQLDESHYAVASYIMAPNIAQRLTPLRLTLRIDKELSDLVTVTHPSTSMTGNAVILSRDKGSTVVSFDVQDDVTWLRFNVESEEDKLRNLAE